MLENLTLLLDDECHYSTSTIANLPKNDDVMRSITMHERETNTVNVSAKMINQLQVVVWKNQSGNYKWFLGYVKKKVGEEYKIDHLHRVIKDSHTKWKYPTKEDMDNADLDQIVDCNIEGDWDFTPDCRKRRFTLTNIKTICSFFEKHIKGNRIILFALYKICFIVYLWFLQPLTYLGKIALEGLSIFPVDLV